MSVETPHYTYFTVTGRYLRRIIDGPDEDRLPDVVPSTGEFLFTPKAASFKDLSIPATFENVSQTATLDAAGYLVDEQGRPGVVLMSGNSPHISPQGWTWTVTPTVNGKRGTTFDLPADIEPGSTVDLTIVSPASSSSGAVIIVSEASRVAAETARDQAVEAAQSLMDGLEGAIEAYLLENPPEGGGAVDSVNGQVGVVSLAKGDVGLSNVDNTSDLGKPISTATQTALTEMVTLGLDSTGTTDVGPRLQALYDSGTRKITLKRGGVYALNSPVFLDSPNFGDKLDLDLNGATLNLGPSLPTANGAFGPDATVKVAFFANTARAGLSSGNVDVQANRATADGASLRFVLRNGRVNAGNANNVIVAFGNRCGTLMENVNLLGGRSLWSWYDYGEPHIMRNCHFQTAGGANQPADAFLMYGVAKGDGILVESPKCDGAIGGVSLRECSGATLNSFITAKIRLSKCDNIVVNAPHMESDIYASYEPNIEVYNSDVTVVGGAFYPPLSATSACVVVDDSDTNNNLNSSVTLLSPEVKYLGKTDQAQGSLVRVKAVNTRNNTTVTVRDLKSKTSGVSASGAGTWRATALPPITSDVTALQTALTAGSYQFSTGSFEVGRIDGAWLVYDPDMPGWRTSRVLTAPAVTQITNATDVTGGTLVSGQSYEYAVAALDGFGNYTTHVIQAYTAGAQQTNRLLLANTKNAALIIWRKTGSGVATTPDRYVIVSSTTNNLVLFDHGENIAGRPWLTTPPVPSTVAAANATRVGLLSPAGEFLGGIEAAVAAKVPTTRTVAGKALSSNISLVKADVGLANVDNTADTSKPVSTPQRTALNNQTQLLYISATAPDTWPDRTAWIAANAPGYTGLVAWNHSMFGQVGVLPSTMVAGDLVGDLP